MKIVQEKTGSKVALYLFQDTDAVAITTDGMTGPRLATDIKPATHEIVENVPAPPFWQGGVLAYDTDWAVVNSGLIIKDLAGLQDEVLIAIENKSDEVKFGGMTVGGIFIKTNPDALAMIHGSKVSDVTNRDWKVSRGVFVTRTVPQVQAIRKAAHDLVQGSISHEKVLSDSVNAATDAAGLISITIYDGWPS